MKVSDKKYGLWMSHFKNGIASSPKKVYASNVDKMGITYYFNNTFYPIVRLRNGVSKVIMSIMWTDEKEELQYDSVSEYYFFSTKKNDCIDFFNKKTKERNKYIKKYGL